MSAPPLRQRVEQASVPLLRTVSRLPAWATGLLVGVLLVAALLVGGAWSVLLAAPVLLGLAWLAYLSWPRLGAAERAVRLLVLGALLVWAVLRLVG